MAQAAPDPIVIVGTARTAIGGFQGAFAPLTAPQLGSAAIKAAVERAGLKADDVSEVLMGCVLPAGQGQAPARQAALGAGLPQSVPCTTVNKMCGSGMKTVMMAYDALHARPADIVVAGGMESMTNAPYLLPKMRARRPARPRRGQGPHVPRRPGGRLRQGPADGHLRRGHRAALPVHARGAGRLRHREPEARQGRPTRTARSPGRSWPVGVKGRAGTAEVARDEQPFTADPAKIPKLKPAFRDGGTVTAANSSSISDGAAALVLMRAERGQAAQARRRWPASPASPASPRRRPGSPPRRSAPSSRLLEQVGWSAGEVGLYEINEAFAVVAMCAMRDLALPHEKVNVHGGACALGHPIGASGARILVTLLGAMEKYGETQGRRRRSASAAARPPRVAVERLA